MSKEEFPKLLGISSKFNIALLTPKKRGSGGKGKLCPLFDVVVVLDVAFVIDFKIDLKLFSFLFLIVS